MVCRVFSYRFIVDVYTIFVLSEFLNRSIFVQSCQVVVNSRNFWFFRNLVEHWVSWSSKLSHLQYRFFWNFWKFLWNVRSWNVRNWVPVSVLRSKLKWSVIYRFPRYISWGEVFFFIPYRFPISVTRCESNFFVIYRFPVSVFWCISNLLVRYWLILRRCVWSVNYRSVSSFLVSCWSVIHRFRSY